MLRAGQRWKGEWIGDGTYGARALFEPMMPSRVLFGISMHERCDPEKSWALYIDQCSRDVVVATSDEREMIGMILSGGGLPGVVSGKFDTERYQLTSGK